jgi:3-dehydroquinate synthase class II
MALMATANGISKIKETVFENRMHHVKELNRMGANITVKDNIATVVGVENLKGSVILGSDLRASAALALAGLSAGGKTLIGGVEHLERGYENFSTKLQEIGAAIVIKKKIKIMFKLNNYFAKISLKKNSNKYTSAFAFSFFIGFFIATIPYIYKFIENFRNQILIQEQRKIQIENKEKICKDKNSDYIKFLDLGFTETANRKFNTCMIDK